GHRVAAGFTLRSAHLPELEARLQGLARERMDPSALTPVLYLEAEAALGDLNWELLRALERMAPFGVQNPQPVFLCPRVKVVRARQVGPQGEHLRLTLSDGRLACDAIGFRLGGRIAECTPGTYLDLACTLGASSWTGEERLELQLRDLRPSRL
ncbi:MAG: single-stranded-DNA-specific exonuclease RecJ, partial [Chloroflexia bacterium]